MKRSPQAIDVMAAGDRPPVTRRMGKNLADKADEDSRDVLLAGEAPGLYRLESRVLLEADEISDEGEFPEYGDFAEVEVLSRTGDVQQNALLEVPQAMAAELQDHDVEAGDPFRVVTARKGPGGQWLIEVEPWDTDA